MLNKEDIEAVCVLAVVLFSLTVMWTNALFNGGIYR